MPDLIIRAAVVPTCGNCHFAGTIPADFKTVLCCGTPPTPVIVGMGPQGPQIAQFRPQMQRADAGCALWRERKGTAA